MKRFFKSAENKAKARISYKIKFNTDAKRKELAAIKAREQRETEKRLQPLVAQELARREALALKKKADREAREAEIKRRVGYNEKTAEQEKLSEISNKLHTKLIESHKLDKITGYEIPKGEQVLPKRRNKVYYKGEHKGERVIIDEEWQLYVANWMTKGEWNKIDFLIKLDEIYASRNQLHCLSNLERLERIKNVFGDD